jgi:hypothetical protein
LPLAKQGLDEAPYKLFGAVAKLAGITFSRLPFSYWIDNLGFITERKLAAIFIKPSLRVSNWPVIYFINYTPTSFLAPSSPRHQWCPIGSLESFLWVTVGASKQNKSSISK